MSKIITIFFFVFLIIISSCSKKESTLDEKFAEIVPQWLEKYEVPAVGIGIIENGEIVFLKVYGELQKGIPAPDNTIFNVASITKTVTTMLTLKLVDKGQWDLDEPLSNYWIDPDIANSPYLNLLTTRHVLTHTTGFLNWRWNHPTYKLTFEFKPGTKFQYSGEGFEYLRKALERKFNKSFDQLADSLLFKPIGMKNTSLSWDRIKDKSRFAEWHDNKGEKCEFSQYFVKETGVSAADDLLTTIEDYCKFGIYVMNGAGISSTLFDDMVKPQSNISEYRATGLGWFLINGLPNEEYAIQHGGSDSGVRTMAIFLPKSKRGIVVFTNGDNGIEIYNNVIKESLDIGNEIYNNLYYRPNIPKMVNVSKEILARYVGSYQYPDNSLEYISISDNGLVMTGEGAKTFIYPQSENKFFHREDDVQVEFISNDKGLVVKMIIYVESNIYAEANKIE